MKKIALFILAVNSLIYGMNYDKHIILKGESLATISKKYEVSVNELVELNGIKNPNLIHVGKELKIYNSNYYSDIYIVKQGDTLGKIAKKFDMKLDQIVKINNIKDENMIYPNMRLKVYSDLIKLAKKYEGIADNIWSSKDLVLKYRLSKSLSTYEIAKQLYLRSEVEHENSIENKVNMLISLKEALRLENLGNIYYVKNDKEKMIKSYEGALKAFEKYKKLSKSIEKNLETKINRITLVMKEVN